VVELKKKEPHSIIYLTYSLMRWEVKRHALMFVMSVILILAMTERDMEYLRMRL